MAIFGHHGRVLVATGRHTTDESFTSLDRSASMMYDDLTRSGHLPQTTEFTDLELESRATLQTSGQIDQEGAKAGFGPTQRPLETATVLRRY
jgi:hypothetical protein